ncbi:MAG: AAA family ATPase [Halanaerobiales bacterium]
MISKEDRIAEYKRIEEYINEQRKKEKSKYNQEKNNKMLPEYVKTALENTASRLNRTNRSSSEYSRLLLRMNYLEKIPWVSEEYESIDIKKAKKILNENHYGLDEVKDEVLEYIYANNKLGSINNEVLLLAGPPGTGKTTIARQIAKALGRDLHRYL